MIKSLHTLDIKFHNGIKIKIPTLYKVQVLNGDSGIGKSRLCYLVELGKSSPLTIESTSIDTNDVLVWDTLSAINTSVTDKLIIIDRYTFLASRDASIAPFIKQSKNKFIVIKHSDIRDIDIPGTADLLLVYDAGKLLYYTKVVS